MSNASAPAASTRSGDVGPDLQPRPPYATRRRILILMAIAIVLAVATFSNYGPLQSYQDAHGRLQKATAELASLEKQKADLQAHLGRLTETGYLESLAREDLTYARPGEEVYIITGSRGATEDDAETDGGLLLQIISEFEGFD